MSLKDSPRNPTSLSSLCTFGSIFISFFFWSAITICELACIFTINTQQQLLSTVRLFDSSAVFFGLSYYFSYQQAQQKKQRPTHQEQNQALIAASWEKKMKAVAQKESRREKRRKKNKKEKKNVYG